MAFDVMQIILVVTIVVLTALLTVLGIEVFYILKDLRKLLERVNGVVGDAEHVVQNIKKPSEMIAGVAHSADLLSKLFEMVKSHEVPDKAPAHLLPEVPVVDRQEDFFIETTPQPQPKITESDTQKSLALGRRFFRVPRRQAS